jgi:hypothetical protein
MTLGGGIGMGGFYSVIAWLFATTQGVFLHCLWTTLVIEQRSCSRDDRRSLFLYRLTLTSIPIMRGYLTIAGPLFCSVAALLLVLVRTIFCREFDILIESQSIGMCICSDME